MTINKIHNALAECSISIISDLTAKTIGSLAGLWCSLVRAHLETDYFLSFLQLFFSKFSWILTGLLWCNLRLGLNALLSCLAGQGNYTINNLKINEKASGCAHACALSSRMRRLIWPNKGKQWTAFLWVNWPEGCFGPRRDPPSEICPSLGIHRPRNHSRKIRCFPSISK